jgi:ProP effector
MRQQKLGGRVVKPTRRRRNARLVQETLAVLIERYPKCFTLAEADRRPLKIGVGGEIVAAHPDIQRSRIGAALAWYTRSWAYLEKLTEGAERVDLAGAGAGVVSASEAADAVEKLAAAKARVRKITPALSGGSKSEPPDSDPPPAPRRLGLGDLREAAQQRKSAGGR